MFGGVAFQDCLNESMESRREATIVNVVSRLNKAGLSPTGSAEIARDG
jgi:hypothetical protein